jgi:hypothetical protein
MGFTYQACHKFERHGPGFPQHKKDVWWYASDFARSSTDPSHEKYGSDVAVQILRNWWKGDIRHS